MAKRNVAYVKPEEPKFLRQLKEQIGYKEGPTVDTKRESLPDATNEDFEDRDDEQPVVVVLEPGDVSAEEAAQINNLQGPKIDDEPPPVDGRILFRKPAKREASPEGEDEGEKPSEKKKQKMEDHRKKRNKQKSVKKVKNASLLSFDEDDNDDV